MIMEDLDGVLNSPSLSAAVSPTAEYRNLGEFGAYTSKPSGLSSTVKTLATSLGVRRTHSSKANANIRSPPHKALQVDDRGGTPFTGAIPHISTDHSALATPGQSASNTDDDTSAPIPGSLSRPGVPAPLNASTIRLITSNSPDASMLSPPKLAPFRTAFDLELCSPVSGASPVRQLRVWPASPGDSNCAREGEERLYPAVPFEDLPVLANVSKTSRARSASPVKAPVASASEPGMRASPPNAQVEVATTTHTSTRTESPMPQSESVQRGETKGEGHTEPFVFGSPLPRHSLSNKAFGDAAASVLEEMNRRLVAEGKTKASAPASERVSIPGLGAAGVTQKATGRGSVAGNKDRFAKAHEVVFNRMDSITTHYAARRPLKRKSEVLDPAASKAKNLKVAGGVRVVSGSMRKHAAMPGEFGDAGEKGEKEQDGEEAGNRRSSKRMRVEEGTSGGDVHKGTPVSAAPSDVQVNEQEKKKQREREAMRRKIEAAKARRRSSKGRASTASTPKGKTPRFSFLSSAKSLVRSVWGGGASPGGAPPLPAPKLDQPTAKPSRAGNPAMQKQKRVTETSTKTEPTVPRKNATVKGTTSTTRSSSSTVSSTSSKASGAASLSKKGGTSGSMKPITTHTRPPIPTFGGTYKGTVSSVSKATSTVRAKTTHETTGGSTKDKSAMNAASSLSRRTPAASAKLSSAPDTKRGTTHTARSNATISKASAEGGSVATQRTSGTTSGTKRTTSSLTAPTASSLARTRGATESTIPSTRSVASSVVADKATLNKQKLTKKPTLTSALSKATLDTITNSPKQPRFPRIFSQPLTSAAFSSSGPDGAPIKGKTAGGTGTPASNPTLAESPKPNELARKLHTSRARVIAKLGVQRSASQPAQNASSGPSTPRPRPSVSPRKTLGGVKSDRSISDAALLQSAAKRARRSEMMKRKVGIVGEEQNMHHNLMDLDP
ncbi:hypothetical protein WOLCODRAFT_140605 [Wolfiporia cocos MD-104 SS10]|uniref:Uncharacterized protein n=1 Tax=Wolfiporia cocos (strain MD-104) TaxID=742152 RepID=A0A2H3J4H0_WOLCO|nr:hypothetical protein WOLCODRAFT_140605 [Wolfiporia cocos MD-104 SS10]